MSIEFVLLPLFVQVLLTFTLLGILAVRRQRMFRDREMHPQDLAVRGAREPQPVAQVAGSFQNQFEIPVLFYVLVILALFTRKADLVFVIMSWIFVAARIAQAAIHVTSMSCRGAASPSASACLSCSSCGSFSSSAFSRIYDTASMTLHD
jgi:hypothetical protein